MTKLKQLIWFVLTPVLLATWGEFALKATINGMHNPQFFDLITHGWIWFAVGLILAGASLWMVGMSKFSLSFLYPFLSINYVCVMVGSQFFLKESVGLYRYLSVVCIVVGLIIISKSPNASK